MRHITANEKRKQLLKDDYEEHLNEKILSRKEKENDQSSVGINFIVAYFDMQAVLQIPKGDVSIIYHKLILNTMNLTVTELGHDTTNNCYIWHEEEGKHYNLKGP